MELKMINKPDIKKWDVLHTVFITTGLLLFHLTGSFLPLMLLAFISIIWLWISQWETIRNFSPPGGLANWITGVRFLSVLIICYFSDRLDNTVIGFLFLAIVTLDFLDGYFARRNRERTEMGRYFDFETDSLFVATACLTVYMKDITGAWILIPGYMRYFYVLLLLVLRMKNIDEKKTIIGSFIAGFMFLSIIAAFFIQSEVIDYILIFSSVLIVISFVRSFVYQMRIPLKSK